jgi:hypothetical protein
MFIAIIFIVSFLSISIKVKMSDSDEHPEITSGLKKAGFNVTNCSNCYSIFILINHFFVEYTGCY